MEAKGVECLFLTLRTAYSASDLRNLEFFHLFAVLLIIR